MHDVHLFQLEPLRWKKDPHLQNLSILSYQEVDHTNVSQPYCFEESTENYLICHPHIPKRLMLNFGNC